MSAGTLIPRAGAPLVIDWGWTPRGAAPADEGGRTPQVAQAFARLFSGIAIDWGRLPRGSGGAAPAAAGDDWIIRTRRRGRRSGR